MNRPAADPRADDPLVTLFDQQFRAWVRATTPATRTAVVERLWDGALREPATAALERPCKQFRARVTASAWQIAGGALEQLPAELPLVVEVLHVGSLIVDDVQDDSRTRRGAPALHRQFGTPLAINTGNLFYCWALDLLSTVRLCPERELALQRRAVDAMLRCHQGQALDLSVQVFAVPQYAIPEVVASSTALKAGALMELAAALGAVGADGTPKHVDALADFGAEFGIGLQMLDDLSGLLNPKRRDKAREDLRLARPTWPWAWLAEDLDEADFEELQQGARGAHSGDPAEPLFAIMAEQLQESGRARVHEHLRRALADLQVRVGTSASLASLQQEVQRLEECYV